MLSMILATSAEVGDKAFDSVVSVIVAQFIVFVLTLIGFVAVGRRFISSEYPGFVSRVESGMKAVETKLSGEITDVRRDVVALRERIVEKSVEDSRIQEKVRTLEEKQRDLSERLGWLERLSRDMNDDTATRRRRTDNQ